MPQRVNRPLEDPTPQPYQGQPIGDSGGGAAPTPNPGDWSGLPIPSGTGPGSWFPPQNPYAPNPPTPPPNDPTGGIDPTGQDPSNPTGTVYYPPVPGLGGPPGVDLGPNPLPGTPQPPPPPPTPQGPTMSGNFPGLSKPPAGTPPTVPGEASGRTPPGYQTYLPPPPLAGSGAQQPPAPTQPTQPTPPSNGMTFGQNIPRPAPGTNAGDPGAGRTPPTWPTTGGMTYNGPPPAPNPGAGRTPPNYPSTGGMQYWGPPPQPTPGGPTYTNNTGTQPQPGGPTMGGNFPPPTTPTTPTYTPPGGLSNPNAPTPPKVSGSTTPNLVGGSAVPYTAGLPTNQPYNFNPISIKTQAPQVGGMMRNSAFGNDTRDGQDPWHPSPTGSLGTGMPPGLRNANIAGQGQGGQPPNYNPRLSQQLGLNPQNRVAQILLGLGGL